MRRPGARWTGGWWLAALTLVGAGGCGRLRVEDRPVIDSVAIAAPIPPPQAGHQAACELARAALGGDPDAETARRALGVLPCAAADTALLAGYWERVGPDTVEVHPLLGASRRAGGQALLDAVLRAARDRDRPASVRLAAVSLLAAYVDPTLLVIPPDTVIAPRERGVPPGTLTRLERRALNTRAPFAAAAPDTVVAALAAIARDDPSQAVRHLAAAVDENLRRQMKQKEWQLADRARRVGTDGTAAGCFALTLYAWTSDTAPAYTKAFRPPRRLELHTTPDSAERVPGARVLTPQVPGARAAWWVHAPDSITVRWASAESGLMLRLSVSPLNLGGGAIAYTAPGGPELTTRALLSRISCER